MIKRIRPNFTPEFRLESVQLGLDQGYFVKEAAEAFAAVVTTKYVDALPLYRQVEILKRSGIELSRGTLSN